LITFEGISTMDDQMNEAEMTMIISSDMDEVEIVEKRQAVLQFKVSASTATFSLDAPQIIIGRAKDVDLRIPDSYLSGKHARILVVHNFYHIEDLGSRTSDLMEQGTPTASLAKRYPYGPELSRLPIPVTPWP
jgi:pSer/pThr/pTyr-binding forkhead associated (FHA) protein